MRSSASTKLTSSVGLLIALTLLVGTGALIVNQRLGNLLEDAINVKAKLRFMAGQIGLQASEMVGAERGLAFSMMLQQTAQADAMRKRFAQADENFTRLAREYMSEVKQGRGASEAANLVSSMESSRRMHAELRALMDQQKMDQALALLNERLLPQLSAMSEASKVLAEIQSAELANTQSAAGTTISVGWWVMLSSVLIALGVGAGVFFVVRNLTQSLRRTVSELSESAQHLATTSQEVSGYSLSLSKSASDQAASLEETSASTEEIHSMTRSNADNSKQAASRMEEASSKVEEANRALTEMVNSMNEISNSSSKISKIIKVIDEIAFQTNILALNAAVEAARAGEAGMGFAVVADEVRNLAQRSAQAAKDTTQLIEESIHSSNNGKHKLDEVARASQSVNELVKAVSALVQEVRLGSEEQERGIEQIAKAVTQMERVTQQVAANAEEGAAAGDELRNHAATVERTVESLQALVGQDSASYRPAQSGSQAKASASLHRLAGAVGHAPAADRSRSHASAPSRQTRQQPASSKSGAIPFASGSRKSSHSPSSNTGSSNTGSSNTATIDKDPFPMDGDFEEF
jgi:methyl-accepting chemotaxis protein